MEIKDKEKLYLEGARIFFKDIKINASYSLYSGDSPQSASITFNNKIADYKLEAGKTLEVIHYTNIQSFCNIINSQTVRMFDCNNLNDDKEIETGLKKLGFQYNEEWLNDLKLFHFIFSASEYNDVEDFNMWRLYGDNGYGVGLVFEIDENFQKWSGIHLSKVSYSDDDENFLKMKKFIDFHNKFQEEHILFNEVPSIIPLMSAFQKSNNWNIEKEFRIVSTCNYDKYDLKIKSTLFESINPYLKHSLNQQVNNFGKLVSYLELPISEKYFEEKLKRETDENIIKNVSEFHPKLKLKKIIFGHNLKQTNKANSLLEYCSNILPIKIGENVKIEFSKF